MAVTADGRLRSPPETQGVADGESRLMIADRSPTHDGTDTLPAGGGPTLYDTSDDVRTAARNRCLHWKGNKRAVAPIVEEPTAYDVWPARAANHGSSAAAKSSGPSPAPADAGPEDLSAVLSRPQLLSDLQHHITTELESLKADFPDIAAARRRLVQPPESDLARANVASDGGDATNASASADEATVMAAIRMSRKGHGKEARRLLAASKAPTSTAIVDVSGEVVGTSTHNNPHDAMAEPCSREDRFRLERVRLFSEVLAEFSRHFKAYRPLLLWVLREFDDFAVYCHKHVWSPDARAEFQEDARREAAAAFADEKRELQAKLVESANELAAVSERLKKYETSQATIRLQLDDKDRTIAARDREIQENAEGRAALLSRITRLEKELWQQRVMLEEPEKRIQALSQTNKDLQDKVTRVQRLYEEQDREKMLLKERADRIEEQLRETKRKAAQSGTNAIVKAEMMAFKKRELDVLENNAKLQARVSHLEARLKDAQEALKISRGDAPTTPRPTWDDYSDVAAASAPSTMKKVQDLVGAYRQLSEVRDQLQREVLTLQQMLGSSYRDDQVALPAGQTLASHPDLAPSYHLQTEHLAPAMRAKWFPKLGLDSTVPGYLKGVGKVPNLQYGRDEVQTLVRALWMARQGVKPGAPWDMFMSKFLSDEAADRGVAPDVFAYNVHHAMSWYSYDPFIGFTRGLVLGFIDEAVFVDMQQVVAKMRRDLMRAASDGSANTTNNADAAEDGGGNDGAPRPPATLSKTKLASALIDSCIERPDTDVKQLIVAAGRDCPGRTTDVELLFNYDAEQGRFSHFLEATYLQYLEGRRRYLAELADALYDAETDDEARLSPPAVAVAFRRVDPNAHVQYLDDTIARCFACSVDQLYPDVDKYSATPTVGVDGERTYGCGDTMTSDVPDVVAMLAQGVVRRFVPPETVSAAGQRAAQSPTAAEEGADGAAAGDGKSPGSKSRSVSPLPGGDEVDEAALEAMAM